MSTNEPIYAQVNPIGYRISHSDVENLLNIKSQENEIILKNIADFFKVTPDRLTKELLTRYAKACEVMNNISVASADQTLQIRLINTIASAKKCFSYDEVLACIELCALHGEMLANFLCIVHEEVLKDEIIIEELGKSNASVKRCLKKNNFYDELNQLDRIKWLVAGKIIEEGNEEDLKKVHCLRIKYFHHWGQSHNDIENDALDALRHISRMASKHLELLDNTDNLKKINTYMKLHVNGQDV